MPHKIAFSFLFTSLHCYDANRYILWLMADSSQVVAGFKAEEGYIRNCPPTSLQSSCSADSHSPGKQASVHTLLSRTFTLALPMSLLLSHSIPRYAPVLWPAKELMQLERGWGFGLILLLFKVAENITHFRNEENLNSGQKGRAAFSNLLPPGLLKFQIPKFPITVSTSWEFWGLKSLHIWKTSGQGGLR